MNARHLQKGRARVGSAPRGQQGPDDLESQPHHSKNGPARGPGEYHLAPAGALSVGIQCPFQPAPQVGYGMQQALNCKLSHIKI
jgi:hypothetical protein